MGYASQEDTFKHGRTRRRLAAALLLFAAPLAAAGGWSCLNPDLEVTCEGVRCAASAAFTPLAVWLQDDGQMEVCAYAGCFAGPGQVQRAGRYALHTGTALARPADGQAEDFAVMVDATDRVGLLKGASFAMPLVCERR